MSANAYKKMLEDVLADDAKKIAVDAITREPIAGDYLEYAGDYEFVPYCTQNAGDCSTCSLVNYGMDCRNNPINNNNNQEVKMKNGNWKVSMYSGKVMIENIKTGFCDWPIKYGDGRIAYDRPYSIPKYAKEMVYKFYNSFNQ